MYVQHTTNGNLILVCLYVDDILLTGSCTSKINKFKKVLMNAFDMVGLGNMVYCLGMEILHSDKGINVHQQYELEFLKRFNLMNCKLAVTPAETNHKLNYDVDGEDVDVTTYEQLVCSMRYMCNTRILRYVKGTLRYEILFPSRVPDDTELRCYSDLD